MDSNHRRHKPADLQSAPFGHSGIRPCFTLTKLSLFFISAKFFNKFFSPVKNGEAGQLLALTASADQSDESDESDRSDLSDSSDFFLILDGETAESGDELLVDRLVVLDCLCERNVYDLVILHTDHHASLVVEESIDCRCSHTRCKDTVVSGR